MSFENVYYVAGTGSDSRCPWSDGKHNDEGEVGGTAAETLASDAQSLQETQ